MKTFNLCICDDDSLESFLERCLAFLKSLPTHKQDKNLIEVVNDERETRQANRKVA
jgi:hypothetical protein